jgi:hypothetical protein
VREKRHGDEAERERSGEGDGWTTRDEERRRFFERKRDRREPAIAHQLASRQQRKFTETTSFGIFIFEKLFLQGEESNFSKLIQPRGSKERNYKVLVISSATD